MEHIFQDRRDELRWRTTGGRILVCALTSACVLLPGCGGGPGNSAASAPPAIASTLGVQLGYAWKSDDQTLRPILGVPRSSQVGQSLVPAAAFVAGTGSASSSFGLLAGADGKLYTMNLPSGATQQTSIPVAAGIVIHFSPSGVAAVVYVPGATSATLITGIPGTLQTQQLAAVSPLLDLAVSDAGAAAGVLQTATGVTVNRLSGSPQQLATLGAAGGINFIGNGDSLLAADAAANSLTLIRTVSTTPAALPLPTAGLLKSPAGVGGSRDGLWAVVANTGESSVVRFDLTGALAPQRILTSGQPTGVQQLAGNGVFRFTEITTGAPVWLADITMQTPTPIFVPALR